MMKLCNVIRLTPNRRERRILKEIADRVSRLWNVANHYCRRRFADTGRVPSYSELCRIAISWEAYRTLPSDIAQEVLKKLSASWKSYLALTKTYRKGTIKEKPGFPRYRKCKRKRFTDWIPIKSPRSFSVDGKRFSMVLPVDMRSAGRLCIPYRGIFRYRGRLKFAELKMDVATGRWYALIVSECNEKKPRQTGRKAAIDIGVGRLATVVIEGERKAFVFSSRELKKDYKYWSKRISEEQSRLEKQGLKTSRRLKRLYRKRWKRLEHAQKAVAKQIALLLARHRVNEVFMGYPKHIRDGKNFGRNNWKLHNFWRHEKLIQFIVSACARKGIVVRLPDERGTSSSCCLCGAKVSRPKTHVVVCREHGTIHADVNGAVNILKRNTPLVGDGAEAAPVSVCILHWNKHVWKCTDAKPAFQTESVPSAA